MRVFTEKKKKSYGFDKIFTAIKLHDRTPVAPEDISVSGINPFICHATQNIKLIPTKKST